MFSEPKSNARNRQSACITGLFRAEGGSANCINAKHHFQKTFCADFLTKKMVKNEGQVQQYYVEDSPPAIIDPDEFDTVQLEIERRKSLGRGTSSTSIF